MDRSKLNIGTYYLRAYACTDEHVKDLKACGIDFVVSMQNEKAHLDLLDKYNIGAVVTGVMPRSFLRDNTSDEAEAEYKKAVESFCDHNAVWGVDCGDEPPLTEFEKYGKIMERVSIDFPGKVPYLNLCPNYGILAACTPEERYSQLGTHDYNEYIESYCKHVGTDYISYDFYLYSCNVKKAYENLITVSNACKLYGKSMWIVLQVNSHVPDRFISENMLRFQAFTAMAFGAENITWACYTAGWWYNQVLDEEGNKTEQYERLKKVNGEIKALADEYMKYKHVRTRFAGFENEEMPESASTSELCLDVSFSGEGKLLISEMISRSGDSKAYFVTAVDDPYDVSGRETVISVNSKEPVKALRTDGKVYEVPCENGFCRFSVRSNESVMII